MSNAERIQTNNAGLQACIAKANALPDAGGETPVEPVLQEKSVTPTKQAQEIVADSDFDGLSKVSVRAIPDEYIVPSGTKTIIENGTHDVTEYASVAVNVPTGGGGDDVTKSIVDRSIESYFDSEIATIGTYAFCGCAKLTDVTVPALTTTGNYAFGSCTALTRVNGSPKTLGGYTFNGCTALSSIDTSELTTIGTYAFQNCKALTDIDLPLVTSVAAYAFNGASSIKHLSLPSLKSMVANAFRGMSITSVDMPIVTNLGNNSFRNVSTLTRATFPSVVSTASEAMRGCTSLEYVDLPVFSQFGTSTFYGCSKLVAVVLRNATKVVTLTNVSSFTGTPIASGTGYVYVPASMVASYQSATNWATFANQIRALEDYTVDGTVTGALDPNKI